MYTGYYGFFNFDWLIAICELCHISDVYIYVRHLLLKGWYLNKYKYTHWNAPHFHDKLIKFPEQNILSTSVIFCLDWKVCTVVWSAYIHTYTHLYIYNFVDYTPIN